MYVNFLFTYSDKKSCHTSTTLQTSIARFVSDSWASCIYSMKCCSVASGVCYVVYCRRLDNTCNDIVDEPFTDALIKLASYMMITVLIIIIIIIIAFLSRLRSWLQMRTTNVILILVELRDDGGLTDSPHRLTVDCFGGYFAAYYDNCVTMTMTIRRERKSFYLLKVWPYHSSHQTS